MQQNYELSESDQSSTDIYASIVIPCYCSGSWIEDLVNEIKDSLGPSDFTYEIILVNDSSPDGGVTDRKLRDLRKSEHVKTINLRFNTGQHRAICCGLDFSSGSRIVIMDDDFQCKPSEIPKLIHGLDDGDYDVVIGAHKKNQPFYRRAGGAFVGRILRKGLLLPKGRSMTSFVCMSRESADAARKFGHSNPILSNLIFKSTPIEKISWVDVEPGKRRHGSSGYNIYRLINSTIDNYVSVTNRPMRTFTLAGASIFLASISVVLWLVLQRIVSGNPPEGYTSVAASIFFFGGISVMGIGVLGEYIGRILFETGASPLYIVRDSSFED
jgi:glycosyltransferase involved in cell wall biosynthesis